MSLKATLCRWHENGTPLCIPFISGRFHSVCYWVAHPKPHKWSHICSGTHDVTVDAVVFSCSWKSQFRFKSSWLWFLSSLCYPWHTVFSNFSLSHHWWPPLVPSIALPASFESSVYNQLLMLMICWYGHRVIFWKADALIAPSFTRSMDITHQWPVPQTSAGHASFISWHKECLALATSIWWCPRVQILAVSVLVMKSWLFLQKLISHSHASFLFPGQFSTTFRP